MLDRAINPVPRRAAPAPFTPSLQGNACVDADASAPRITAPFFPCAWAPMPLRSGAGLDASGDHALDLDTDDAPLEWSEQEIVLLHWRLLQEISSLADPATPLEDKFDTLRWIFTDPEKDGKPFSFTSCLRVVGCSPLSPAPYCGLVDPQEVREHIRRGLKVWLHETLERYPGWLREAVIRNPAWAEARLARNPQWINRQLKRMSVEGDLFA